MGKMRHVGVSNFKPHDFTLLQSALKNRILTNQIEISVTAPEALTNGDIANLVIAWLLYHPSNISPVIGTNQ